MLSHPNRTRTRLAQLADGGLFMLSLAAAYSLRVVLAPVLNLPPLEDITDYLWLFVWVGAFGPVMLAAQGLYDQPRITSRLGVIMIILRGGGFTVMGTILLLFLVRGQFARSVVMLVGGMGSLLVFARHELSGWSRRNEIWRRRVVWIGGSDENQRAQVNLSGIENDTLITVAEFDPATADDEAFVKLLHDNAVNAVVCNLAGCDPARLAPLLAACEREGVEVLIRPGLPIRATYRLAVDEFAGEPVFYLRAQSAAPAQLAVKQVGDYLGAAGLTILLLPLGLLIAVAIKASSRGPMLFSQERAGLNGRSFRILKFRTMRVGAETERSALADQNELIGPAFKLRDDPRVTPFGRFLRRHSLDELPQLWNVLRGEMSLVGPRPLPMEETALIEEDAQRRRLSVKPGMTGLWQINGRSELADFTDWVRLDLAYIDQWSLWLDTKILLATIPVALLGHGGR